MNTIILLWLLSIFLLIILIKLLNINKNSIVCFLILLSIIIFVTHINTAIAAVITSVTLCINSILPTLFPFSVICNLLIQYDGILLFSKILGPIFCKPFNLSKECSFPIAASFICGYPLGAKYSSNLYELGYISKGEYSKLLNIATNCGPIFIIGTIGYTFLKDLNSGYILLFANYLSIFIMAIIMNFKKDKKNQKKNESIYSQKFLQEHKNQINFAQALKTSIDSSINTLLSVCGFIILFSIIISILDKYSVNSIILGTIEITNGTKLISMQKYSYPFKLALISFFSSFSGLCIILQCSSFFSRHNISIIKYSFYKIIQGIISFIITYFICLFISKTAFTSSINYNYTNNIPISVFLIPTITIIIIYIFLKIVKKLFSHIP